MPLASFLKDATTSLFILSIILLFGCNEETTVVKEIGGRTQDFRTQSYVSTYYFVDTLYRKFWEPLHQGQAFEISQEMQDNMVIQLDLWMSTSMSSGGKIIKARAYTDLPPRLSSQSYPDVVEDSLGRFPGQKFVGNFFQLEPAKHYTFRFDGSRQMFAGYVVLNTTVPDEQALAVTYTVSGNGQPRAYGTITGTFHDTTADGFFLLKLIKPPGLTSSPGYKPAWNLQLRNIYPIYGARLNQFGSTIQVLRQTETDDVDQINGQNLLKVLGLDRFDASLNRNPDNVFDFIPGLTVDTGRSEMIFPTLRPFDSGIAEYFAKMGMPLTNDSLLFHDIYDTTYMAAQNNVVKNRYLIRIIEKFRDP